MTYQIIPLRWDQYEMTTNIPGELLHNTTARYEVYDALRDQYAARIITDILCDDLEPEVVQSIKTAEFWHPATTWQMFKHRNGDRWFMRWIVRRRPVAMAVEKRTVVFTVIIDRKDVYPSAKYTRELGEGYRKIVVTHD